MTRHVLIRWKMNNYPYIKYVIGNINKKYYAST